MFMYKTRENALFCILDLKNKFKGTALIYVICDANAS